MKKRGKQLMLLVVLLLLILNPSISITGARNGLLLWYGTVVPTLLPFIIISNLILKTGAISYFNYLFYPIYHHFPKLLKSLSYLLIIGFFCGYPMGAKIINDLISSGQMTEDQGKFLMCICNNASPMFISGYVISATLGDKFPALVFFGFIYLPIVIYFFLMILLHPKLLMDTSFQPEKSILTSQETSFDSSIMSAFFIIIKIGAYIMLFSILANLLIGIKTSCSLSKAVLIGYSEVTTGVQYLNSLHLPIAQKTALIAAATAFGGLSSVAQTQSVAAESKLPVLPYILTKLMLSAVTYLFARAYFLL